MKQNKTNTKCDNNNNKPVRGVAWRPSHSFSRAQLASGSGLWLSLSLNLEAAARKKPKVSALPVSCEWNSKNETQLKKRADRARHEDVSSFHCGASPRRTGSFDYLMQCQKRKSIAIGVAELVAISRRLRLEVRMNLDV